MTDEVKEPEQEKAEKPAEISEPEKEADADSLLNKTIKATDELKKATADMKVQLDRAEKLKAIDMMGGRSGGGPSAPREETPAEYKRRIEGGNYGKDRKV